MTTMTRTYELTHGRKPSRTARALWFLTVIQKDGHRTDVQVFGTLKEATAEIREDFSNIVAVIVQP